MGVGQLRNEENRQNKREKKEKMGKKEEKYLHVAVDVGPAAAAPGRALRDILGFRVQGLGFRDEGLTGEK